MPTNPDYVRVPWGNSEVFILFVAPTALEGDRTEAPVQLQDSWSGAPERRPDVPSASLMQCATELATRLVEAFDAQRERGDTAQNERGELGYRLQTVGDDCVVLALREARKRAQLPDRWSKRLTRRELEVVTHVVDGLPNRWIANELGIATATVKRHVSNSFDKLGCDSRAQLIARARLAS